LTSYCSKRFSWRISIVSRNPSVVTSAVFAPLRSMIALVARVVPWMISGGQRRLAQHRADRRQHAALGRVRRRQDLGAEPLAAPLERDIGEGAADIDPEPGFALCCHAANQTEG
jgi:hypothetical protein